MFSEEVLKGKQITPPPAAGQASAKKPGHPLHRSWRGRRGRELREDRAREVLKASCYGSGTEGGRAKALIRLRTIRFPE